MSPGSNRTAFPVAVFLAATGAVRLTAYTAESGREVDMKVALQWEQLPPIPDREGFAATFAGISGDVLIVAGGANFPDKRPWEGGTKIWYDSIFVMEQPGGVWKLAGKLPRPNAYGVSVSSNEGVICIGGGDAQQHLRDVFRLGWDRGRITTMALPSLPKPCAFASGALVGETIYVSGGIEQPDATRCLNTVWVMDLSQPLPRWQELPACPGGERMLAVAGAAAESFYLFSGTRLKPGPDGKPVREYLRDSWRYTPGQGWQRLADLPRAAAAAPSPAPLVADSRLLVISGDDGTKVGYKPETAHPGFPRDVLEYDVRRDVWLNAGEAPFSRATVPTAVWHRRMVIPNGEARPGYRSPEVWALDVNPRR